MIRERPLRKKPNIPSRKPFSHDAKGFRQHAERVGRTALAWNDLHASLYMIFWNLIGLSGHPYEPQKAHSLWHTSQSDKTQRSMLEAVAETGLSENSGALVRLRWILGCTEQFSRYRNLAAHTAILAHKNPLGSPKPDPWSTAKDKQTLFAAINHGRFWKLLAGDLNALSRYTEHLSDELWRPDAPRSSLRKPKLQSLPLIARINNQISQNKQKLSQKRPPPTSPKTGGKARQGQRERAS